MRLLVEYVLFSSLENCCFVPVDKRRILGFDNKGLPMNTGQVTPNSLESLFSQV